MTPRPPAASGPEASALRATEVELFSLAGHDGLLREVNGAFARLLGIPLAEIAGRSLLELVDPDDLERVVAGLSALEAGAPEVLFECRFLQRGGSMVHLQWVARPADGIDGWWASGRDTTAFHRLLAEQIDLRARFDLALGKATAALWELDVPSGRFTWGHEAAALLGVELGGVPQDAAALAALVHPDDAEGLRAAIDELATDGAAEVGVRVGVEPGLRHLSLRGRVLDHDRRGRAVRAVGLVLDVTVEKAMEEQMLRMVMRDALTGAPNRRAFDQAVRGEWRRSTRAGSQLSVVMIDIDDFKAFNDAFGHLVGDEALCAVARALAAALHREGDLLARFGGEEFAVVLPGADHEGAREVAGRLAEAVRAVVVRQAPGWALTVSVGTASRAAGDADGTPRELLARADEALYAAKAAGKDRVVVYEHVLAARARQEAEIAAGLAAEQFTLHYQPLIGLDSGAVVGFEALMRWNRPGHGLVPPDDFIPVAEASSLICDLGRWALREACRQLARWRADGLDPERMLRVAVNISGRHMATPAIVEDVEAALAETGIAPERLELELTETTLLDAGVAEEHLARLRARGVSVALDDFGTGFTSIGQLSGLPVDTLKIDRSFVGSADARRRGLVTLIIQAAHAFGLGVVAEGVEDLETLQELGDLGCDTVQGFLMARPMDPERAAGWLAGRTGMPSGAL
ncbi:MAG: EAL domain-containing protein [Thermoleophilia bacterium]|nr:EAL domain-containing protein [Thermoleophilia bacterium]